MNDLAVSADGRARRWPIWLALWIVGLAIAGLLDMPLVVHMVPRTHAFTKNDFGLFLRNGGYLATWIVVGCAIAGYDARVNHYRPFDSWRRGLTVIVSSVAGGILAECMKAICRRQRLEYHETEVGEAVVTHVERWYDYRPFWDKTFDTGGLSMPSSHVLVAFAGAFVVARMFPGTRWVVLGYACGTAFSRIAGGAHYLSDVYVAIGLGWVVARLTERLFVWWAAKREAR